MELNKKIQEECFNTYIFKTKGEIFICTIIQDKASKYITSTAWN